MDRRRPEQQRDACLGVDVPVSGTVDAHVAEWDSGHPDWGAGAEIRIARLAANAKLSVAGEVRLMIPNVYRNHYLAALNGFSNRAGRGESIVAVLEFAQRWAAAVDWTTYEDANETLRSANAYIDAGLADSTDIRLTMPA